MSGPRSLLFAVDHIFEVAEDGLVYTVGGKFPYSAWETYLDAFDEVVVFSRGRQMRGEGAKTQSLSSGPRVRHHLVKSHRGAKRILASLASNSALRAEVTEAAAVVGRIPSEFGLSAAKYAQQLGKPYLLELVACPWDALWNHGSLASRAYAPILSKRVRGAVRRAPEVRYVTAEFLQRRYPTDGRATYASNVMLPPISSGLLETRIARLADVARGIGRPLTFGTIGALHTRLKGIHIALEALAMSKANLPPFVYRVLGEGDASALNEVVQRLGLEDQVEFDGTVPADAVAPWLDSIDIYLQPSFQEGLPRGLIEALSRGCLAVGSTAGGIPELLSPEVLHPPGDARQLSVAILFLQSQIVSGVADISVEVSLSTARKYEAEKLKRQRQISISRLRDSVNDRTKLTCLDEL